MFEELGNDGCFKEGGIFDNKGLAIFGPGADFGVACVNHVVGLCRIMGGRLWRGDCSSRKVCEYCGLEKVVQGHEQIN